MKILASCFIAIFALACAIFGGLYLSLFVAFGVGGLLGELLAIPFGLLGFGISLIVGYYLIKFVNRK